MQTFLSRQRLILGITVFAFIFLFYGRTGADTQSVQPRFTKLDSQGADLPADATAWAMALDNKTKLIWEVKTDDNSIHDTDNLYKTWEAAEKIFIGELNKNKFGGFSDWRLPTVDEIQTIYKKGNTEPYIDTDYFPNTTPGKYWVSWICGDGTFMTKRMKFAKKPDRSKDRRVRAVRGGKSE